MVGVDLSCMVYDVMMNEAGLSWMCFVLFELSLWTVAYWAASLHNFIVDRSHR